MAVFKLSPARERKRCRTDLVSDSETEAVSEEEGKRVAMEVDSQLAVRSQMRDTIEDTQPQTSGGGMSVVSIDEADAMRAKISALSADCAELEAKVSTNHIRFLIHNQQQQQQKCSKATSRVPRPQVGVGVLFGWGRNLQRAFDDDWTFLLDLQDVICM